MPEHKAAKHLWKRRTITLNLRTISLHLAYELARGLNDIFFYCREDQAQQGKDNPVKIPQVRDHTCFDSSCITRVFRALEHPHLRRSSGTIKSHMTLTAVEVYTGTNYIWLRITRGPIKVALRKENRLLMDSKNLHGKANWTPSCIEGSLTLRQ